MDGEERPMTDGNVFRRGTLLVVAVAVGACLAVAAAGFGVAGTHAAEAADTVAVESCFGTTIRLLPQEKRLLYLHNRERSERGLSRLCVHPKMQQAAREHSQDMMSRDYFSHFTRGSGADPGRRLRRAGYHWSGYGENIGWAHRTAANPNDVFEGWMSSCADSGQECHRRTMLRGRWREVGIGWVQGRFEPKPGQAYRNAVISTVDYGVR